MWLRKCGSVSRYRNTATACHSNAAHHFTQRHHIILTHRIHRTLSIEGPTIWITSLTSTMERTLPLDERFALPLNNFLLARFSPIAIAAQAWETAQSPLPPKYRYFFSEEPVDPEQLCGQAFLLAGILLHSLFIYPILDWCFVKSYGSQSKKWQTARAAAMVLGVWMAVVTVRLSGTVA